MVVWQGAPAESAPTAVKWAGGSQMVYGMATRGRIALMNGSQEIKSISLRNDDMFFNIEFTSDN